MALRYDETKLAEIVAALGGAFERLKPNIEATVSLIKRLPDREDKEVLFDLLDGVMEFVDAAYASAKEAINAVVEVKDEEENG